MIFGIEPRTIGITKEEVWAAWKKIRKGGQSAGIDSVTTEKINLNARKYLYPVWNRMSSGSYFPPVAKWVKTKYKIRRKRKCFAWLRRVAKYYPTMIAHWKYGWVP